MDANELVEGIEHFFRNILPKAYYFPQWDEGHFMNAFHWAKFCKQIYKEYKDKPCRESLDKLIHSLSSKFDNAAEEFCFEDLNRSIEILCEAFFENPRVDNKLVESLLLSVKNDNNSFELITEGHELDSLCCELIEALKPVKMINSEKSFYNDVGATLYLKYLEMAVRQMSSEEQVEAFLSNSLEKLCETPDDMMKLIGILMLKLNDDVSSSSWLKDTKQFVINWIISKILSCEDHPLAQFMWKQPSELRALSLSNSDFLDFYLRDLSRSATSLSDVLVDNETEWIKYPFSEILNHFRCLLSIDDCVGESTKRYLLHKLNTRPEEEIWKEIFSRVT